MCMGLEKKRTSQEFRVSPLRVERLRAALEWLGYVKVVAVDNSVEPVYLVEADRYE
jgi:hypothetical protein